MAVSIDNQVDTVMRRKTSRPSGPDAARASAVPVFPLAYGIEDAADALGLSRSRIYELIATGEIVACKVGKRTIIPTTELTAFLERHRVEMPSNLPEARGDAAGKQRGRDQAQCASR
jgi:excisionase family DNA binding protein